MKSRILLFAFCLLPFALLAQPQPKGNPQVVSQMVFPLSVGAPAAPALVNVNRTGNPGPGRYYYWVVANYTIGSSAPAGPGIAANAPNTLDSSNFLTPSWTPALGASSYDVLRTTTPTPPAGICACAVATGVTGTSTNDQSNSLNAYSVAPFDPNTVTLVLQNEVQGAGSAHLILRNLSTGALLADLSTGGGVSLPCTLIPNGVQFNNAGAFGCDSKITYAPATGLALSRSALPTGTVYNVGEDSISWLIGQPESSLATFFKGFIGGPLNAGVMSNVGNQYAVNFASFAQGTDPLGVYSVVRGGNSAFGPLIATQTTSVVTGAGAKGVGFWAQAWADGAAVNRLNPIEIDAPEFFNAGSTTDAWGIHIENFQVAGVAAGKGVGIFFENQSTGYAMRQSDGAGGFNFSLDGSGNLTAAQITAAQIATGAGAPSCGVAITGCVALAETGSAGTPGAGFDYIRADSGHNLLASLNGVAETPIALLGKAQTWPAAQAFGNISSTGIVNFNAASSFAIRVLAGGTAGPDGSMIVDTTTHMLHAGQANVDTMIPQFTVTPVNGDCANWSVSGSTYKLGDAGAACGSGNGGQTNIFGVSQRSDWFAWDGTNGLIQQGSSCHWALAGGTNAYNDGSATDPPFISIATSGTINEDDGWSSDPCWIRGAVSIAGQTINRNPSAESWFKVDAELTNKRMFFGFTDASIGGQLASDAPAQNYAGIAFSTSRASTHFWCVQKDSTTETATDSAVVGDTAWHQFKISVNDATPAIDYYIDGVKVCSAVATHLPTAGVKMRVIESVGNITSAAAVHLKFGFPYTQAAF